MTSTLSPSAGVDRLDAVLMKIPYGQWIPLPEAMQILKRAEIPGYLRARTIRRGRRRGVLRTDPKASVTYVMRVRREPDRPSGSVF